MLNTIYKITNLVNNKIYIGKTTSTVEERLKEHINDSKKERCKKRPLYDAMNKYGTDNFTIEIVETDIQDEQINDKEQYYIKQYNSYVGFDNSNGYNATLGGDSRKYKEYSIETIVQMYANDKNCAEIAKEVNLDKAFIRRLLKANGVVLRSSEEEVIKKCGKKVYQLDKNTKEILNIFNSSGLANIAMGKSRGNGTIPDALRGRRGHHIAYGYEWLHEEDYNKEYLNK